MAKLPTSEQLNYGELAVNYKKGYEVLSFKNDEDEIVTISVMLSSYVRMHFLLK